MCSTSLLIGQCFVWDYQLRYAWGCPKNAGATGRLSSKPVDITDLEKLISWSIQAQQNELMAAIDLKLQAMSQSGWMLNTARVNLWPPLQAAPLSVWAQANPLQHNMNSWNLTPAQWRSSLQTSVTQMAPNTAPGTVPHQAGKYQPHSRPWMWDD